MVNVRAIDKTIAAIEEADRRTSKSKVGFNMRSFRTERDDHEYEDLTGRECDTVACLGGWVVLANDGYEAFSSMRVFDMEFRAEKLLGLNHDERIRLFVPLQVQFSRWSRIGPRVAVQALKYLRATGTVAPWDKLLEGALPEY